MPNRITDHEASQVIQEILTESMTLSYTNLYDLQRQVVILRAKAVQQETGIREVIQRLCGLSRRIRSREGNEYTWEKRAELITKMVEDLLL